MKKRKSEEFESMLHDKVREIERDSSIELVVYIVSYTAKYRDTGLWLALAGLVLTHTLLVFLPATISDEVIFFGPILTFLILTGLVNVLPVIKKPLIPKSRMKATVDLHASAIFEKGGLHHTSGETGMLIYLSEFEKCGVVVADRGITTNIPYKIFDEMQEKLTRMAEKGNIEKDVIPFLEGIKPMFTKYLPAVGENINEIPEVVEINLGEL